MYSLVKPATAVLIGFGMIGAALNASPAATPPAVAAETGEVVCKHVVSAMRGSKPVEMCLTKAQWAAKEEQDAKDANRIVCRYEEKPGTKIGGRKICQPASEWAEQARMYREFVEDIQMETGPPR